MSITIIDDVTYKKYTNLLMCIYDVSEDYINNIKLNNQNKHNKILPIDEVYECIRKYDEDISGKDFEVIIFIGRRAKTLLQHDPIQACTIFLDNSVKCFITWETDIELLKRVVLHELCHANRIINNGIQNEIEYIKYLNNLINWLYEEMLAISTEKKYFPHLDWSEIVGIKYHEQFICFEKEALARNISSVNDILNLVYAHQEELECYIYFLAYYLSKKSGLDEKLPILMNLNYNQAFESLLYSFKL